MTHVVAFRSLILLAVSLNFAGCAYLPGLGEADGMAARPMPSDSFPLPGDDEDVVGRVQVTTAHTDDTLADIARRYNLGQQEIIAANPDVDPWLPRGGTRVVLPTQFILPPGPREGLVLNLAAMRLFYYPPPQDGEQRRVITHPIGIGREGWATPEGLLHVTHKKIKPAWTVPESVRREHAARGDFLPPIVANGPDNPLGDYAMRLSNPVYLIHGTNQPYGVGLRVSHGCVRLYPEDIERLFPRIPIGTPVRIVNQPYLSGRRDGHLYLEAHAPLAEQARQWGASLEPMRAAVMTRANGRIDWARAERVTRQALGIPLPIDAGSPDAEEVLRDAPWVPSRPPWVVAENFEP